MAALEDDATVDDADAEPPQESALRLSLLGDEAHVGLFLLAGWAKREARGCNWERVDEGAGIGGVEAHVRRDDQVQRPRERRRGAVLVAAVGPA